MGGKALSRVQLAMNVSELDRAVEFYSKLLSTSPSKLRPGYANFIVADPPLKLVLFEKGSVRGSGAGGALNHLGIEVDAPGDVVKASGRLTSEGLETEEQHRTTCCYALQDKVWVDDPDGASWEIYTVIADAPSETTLEGDGSCCAENSRVEAAGRGVGENASTRCC
jgi:catechol 2,3-dioxygenase-like lactoylglutathione lyase family enzyme